MRGGYQVAWHCMKANTSHQHNMPQEHGTHARMPFFHSCPGPLKYISQRTRQNRSLVPLSTLKSCDYRPWNTTLPRSCRYHNKRRRQVRLKRNSVIRQKSPPCQILSKNLLASRLAENTGESLLRCHCTVSRTRVDASTVPLCERSRTEVHVV